MYVGRYVCKYFCKYEKDYRLGVEICMYIHNFPEGVLEEVVGINSLQNHNFALATTDIAWVAILPNASGK